MAVDDVMMAAPESGALGRYDAVVLAGGGGRRLGGADKPALVFGERTLAAVAVSAAAEAETVIVVGPKRDELTALRLSSSLRVVVEDPPGSGPVPALRRGLAEVRAPWVVVLAADLPFLRAKQVTALVGAAHAAVASASPSSGAILHDDRDLPQWLIGCWRTWALAAAAAIYRGSSMRGLLAPLCPVPLAIEVPPGMPEPWLDCDTQADLDRARRWRNGETA